jgi:peptidoglycan LD-endopeptidase LytH
MSTVPAPHPPRPARHAWPVVAVLAVVILAGLALVGVVRWVGVTSGDVGGPGPGGLVAAPAPDPDRPPAPAVRGGPKTGAAPQTPSAPAPSPRSGPGPAPEAGTYVFPIDPPEAASYAREHHTYPATDIFAACGTTVVAITDATVDEVGTSDTWDPAEDDPATRSGLFVSLVGDDGVRYYTSHLEAVAPEVQAGARVRAGQPVGRVGRSGNAAATPCHVHVGISPPLGPGDWEVRRGVIWPWPYLDAWRAGEARSPIDEVHAWTAP